MTDSAATTGHMVKPSVAARAAGLHPNTVRRWIIQGRLTQVTRSRTGRYRVSLAEVMAEVQGLGLDAE